MVDEKIVIILLLAVFGIVLAVINSKREVNKMRIEKDARDDTKASALTNAINEKWIEEHGNDIDMCVIP